MTAGVESITFSMPTFYAEYAQMSTEERQFVTNPASLFPKMNLPDLSTSGRFGDI